MQRIAGADRQMRVWVDRPLVLCTGYDLLASPATDSAERGKSELYSVTALSAHRTDAMIDRLSDGEVKKVQVRKVGVAYIIHDFVER